MVLRSFGLTHVEYEQGDNLGFVLALFSLSPVLILIMLCTLISFRRDIQSIFSLLGLFITVLVNVVLKHSIQELRPPHVDRDPHDTLIQSEFGMPSNHAQFAFHFAAFYSMLFLFRSWSLSFKYRLTYSAMLFAFASLTSYSRVYLHYHTFNQVIVGCIVGVGTGMLWYAWLVSVSVPIANMVRELALAKWFCIRDYSTFISYGPIDEYRIITDYQQHQETKIKN